MDSETCSTVKKIYSCNNQLYEIDAPPEMHDALENDHDFSTKYFEELSESIKKRDDNNVQSATDVQQDDKNDNAKENILGEVRENNSSANGELGDMQKFDDSMIKLLLNEYLIRKEKFRDPKIQKKRVWNEIVKEFEKKGYQMTWSSLDRKFRNLKMTFKRIALNNSKTSTGGGRIQWPWLDSLANIFHTDKSVNFEQGLSSMASREEEAIDFSVPRVLSGETDDNEASENSIIEAGSSCEDIGLPELSESLPVQSDPPIRNRGLYMQRKQLIEIEARKATLLQQIDNRLKDHTSKMVEAYERRTRILEERNELLKALVNRTEKPSD